MKIPLQIDGLIIKNSAQKVFNGNITDIDTGIFVDDSGNMVFRDTFVSDYLGKDSVSLKELYTRSKGIYYQDGKLYFKDPSLSRAYSLDEIVASCANWKKNLTGGSLWWVGRVETDHTECANLPRDNNPTNTQKVFWSVDRYLYEALGSVPCGSDRSAEFFNSTVDQNGQWRWYDIQNMQMVVPPIEDSTKLAMITVNMAYIQQNGTEPIVFRIYDATAGVELARVAVTQNSLRQISFPVNLNYFGPLTIASFTKNKTITDPGVCLTDDDCGCVTTDCIEGDPTCFVPNPNFIKTSYPADSHLIKVQFHVNDYHSNPYDRYFGANIDFTSAAKSSINCVIFDASQSTKYLRRNGTQLFQNVNYIDIVFDIALSIDTYSVGLTCDHNINVWYSNKTKNGFRINSERLFLGYVDWTLLNVKD